MVKAETALHTAARMARQAAQVFEERSFFKYSSVMFSNLHYKLYIIYIYIYIYVYVY